MEAGLQTWPVPKSNPAQHSPTVYIDIVTVASAPETYEDRLIDFLPNGFRKLGEVQGYAS